MTATTCEQTPLSPDEHERQRALDELSLVDTPPEDAFDDVVALASELCDTPIALFSLIDHGRQWFKSAVGIDITETTRNVSFCAYAIAQAHRPFVVDNASDDVRFRDSPLVTGGPRIRFYAGVPVAAPNGKPIGTLCVMDHRTRSLTAVQRHALVVLARQIEAQLALRQTVLLHIKAAREKRELTEMIIHDLKSPLASIGPNAEYIAEVSGAVDVRLAAADIKDAAHRMHRLVLDVLDTSMTVDTGVRLRLGALDIGVLLQDIADQTLGRARGLGTTLDVDPASHGILVDADSDLVRRVVENLLDNALKYAANGGGHVRLAARDKDGRVEVSVSDDGAGIATADHARIFHRGARLSGVDAAASTSRGLGLRFCAIAVEAHGGRIVVEHNRPQGTLFRFTLPAASMSTPPGPAIH